MKISQKKFTGIILSAADIEFMKDSESREWIRRFNQKKLTIGSTKALLWWQGVCVDLERIRGKSDTLLLRDRMTRLRNEESSKS
jgi:hypothetical protein